MGATDILSRKSGVIVGDDVLKLFQYAREKQFAIPAIVRRPKFDQNESDKGEHAQRWIGKAT